jgi:hypothetical protein
MSTEFKLYLGTARGIETMTETMGGRGMGSHEMQEHIQRWTRQMCEIFGGCTVNILDSNYIKDSDGTLCNETSFTFTSLVVDDDTQKLAFVSSALEGIAEDMKETFNEPCVLIQRTQCELKFIK